tara:strand:- start:2698 stop:3147 length:450 start_codon:yes stop_codon:yes gene_type:complete
MAHFAELDSNNKVLNILVGDNNDVNANGGDQSESAANYFASYTPFSEQGVKFVQCSYNNNFKKQYPRIGDYYDPIADQFVLAQPFSSWSLDQNNDWQAPIVFPSSTTYGDGSSHYIVLWDEDNIRWIGFDNLDNKFYWDPNTSSWISTL